VPAMASRTPTSPLLRPFVVALIALAMAAAAAMAGSGPRLVESGMLMRCMHTELTQVKYRAKGGYSLELSVMNATPSVKECDVMRKRMRSELRTL
jgi:hypothetical protein